MRKLLFVLLFLSTVFGNMLNGFACENIRELCEKINEITIIPLRDEHVPDNVYNGIIRMGKAALPYLIEKVSDTTRMADPRQTPTYHGITVGDVALLILCRIVYIPLDEILPAQVLQGWEDGGGMYAYFEFVETAKNRAMLKANLETWYQNGAKENPAFHGRFFYW